MSGGHRKGSCDLMKLLLDALRITRPPLGYSSGGGAAVAELLSGRGGKIRKGRGRGGRRGKGGTILFCLWLQDKNQPKGESERDREKEGKKKSRHLQTCI